MVLADTGGQQDLHEPGRPDDAETLERVRHEARQPLVLRFQAVVEVVRQRSTTEHDRNAHRQQRQACCAEEQPSREPGRVAETRSASAASRRVGRPRQGSVRFPSPSSQLSQPLVRGRRPVHSAAAAPYVAAHPAVAHIPRLPGRGTADPRERRQTGTTERRPWDDLTATPSTRPSGDGERSRPRCRGDAAINGSSRSMRLHLRRPVRGVPAQGDEWFRDGCRWTQPGQPDPEVPVLVHPEADVEPAGPSQRR